MYKIDTMFWFPMFLSLPNFFLTNCVTTCINLMGTRFQTPLLLDAFLLQSRRDNLIYKYHVGVNSQLLNIVIMPGIFLWTIYMGLPHMTHGFYINVLIFIFQTKIPSLRISTQDT
ncbi:hypothetical protein ACJX0J_006781, partial [Zea mays]